MRTGRISGIVGRHTLAVICIVGPIFFALIVLDAAVSWLVPKNVQAIPMTFEFATGAPEQAKAGGGWIERIPMAFEFAIAARSTKRELISGSTTLPDGMASSTAATRQSEGLQRTGKADQPDSKIYLSAQDISGRFHYAVASASLYLISAAAFMFAAAVVYMRSGIKALLVSIIGFTVVALAIAQNPRSFELIRPLVVDRVLNASDEQPALRRLAFDGYKTGDLVAGLVHFNTFIALLAVGMLLAGLYSVSVRRTGADLTLEDLKTRRFIARCLLALGSAILVISVVASKILVEWPPSLLTESQQLALKPIGEASTILLGAMGTIALFAAFAPAVVAYVLDVRSFRSRPAEHHFVGAPTGASESGENRATDKTKSWQSYDDLGFAALSSMAGLIEILAPILVAPLVEILKVIFASS